MVNSFGHVSDFAVPFSIECSVPDSGFTLVSKPCKDTVKDLLKLLLPETAHGKREYFALSFA